MNQSNSFVRAFLYLSLLSLTACGGGGGGGDGRDFASGGGGGATGNPIAPNFQVDEKSSHAQQSSNLLAVRQDVRAGNNSGTFAHAMAYADFNADGRIDLFIAGGNSVDGTPMELYLDNGAGQLVLDETFFDGSPPAMVHPRKAITGDYNDDGQPDIMVLGHGQDQPPFPDEPPVLILSSPQGYVLGAGLDALLGFLHGGASADIDADGDLDIFVTDTSTPIKSHQIILHFLSEIGGHTAFGIGCLCSQKSDSLIQANRKVGRDFETTLSLT